MLDTKINLFFEDPENDPNRPGEYGILYLLRRDIWFCFGRNPTTNCKTTKALWPGAMAILAGIDLLAKFLEGNDDTHKVGPRFKAFVRKYFKPLSREEDETIYQLRNSLLHSFGLYSYSEKLKQTYHFVLTEGGTTLIEKVPTDVYWVDLTILHSSFEEAIDRYRADLSGDSLLQGNFLKMFENYGSTRIRRVPS